jgi:hypothetical protein
MHRAIKAQMESKDSIHRWMKKWLRSLPPLNRQWSPPDFDPTKLAKQPSSVDLIYKKQNDGRMGISTPDTSHFRLH